MAYGDDAAAIRSAVIDFLLCVSEKQLALAILKESVHQQSILDRLWALIRTPSLQSSVAPELALWNLLLRSQLVDRIPHGAHAGICESLQQSFSSFRRRDFAALNADVTIIFGIGECVRGVCSACFAEWTQWTACPGASERDEARLFMTPSSSLTDLALAAGSGVVAAAGGGVVELAPPSSDTGTRAATGAGGDQTESCSAEKHPRVILDPSAPLYDSLVSIVHDRVRTFLTMPGSVPVPNVSTTESVVWEVLAQCLGLYPPTLGGCPPVRFSGRDLVELMWSLNRTLPGLAIELVFHILTKFPALLSYFGRTGGVGYSLQALCSPSPPESDCGVQVLSLLVRHSRSSQEVFALLLRVVDCDKLARPFIVTPGAPARRPEIVSLALETLTTLFRTCPGSGSVFQRFPRFVRAIQAAADPSPENGSEWQQQATELLDIMGCSRP